MLIDVVIPVHGHDHLLPEALTSLHNQGVDVAVIVVDDGNDRQLCDLARFVSGDVVSLQLIRRDENGGISAARNTGLGLCHGDAVMFLDADDQLHPGALLRLSNALQDTDADASYGFVEEFGAEVSHERRSRAAAKPAMLAGSTLLRRGRLVELGGFDESLRVGEFVDLMARATRRNWMITPTPVSVLRRRIHDRNTSWSGNSSDFLRVVRGHLKNLGSK